MECGSCDADDLCLAYDSSPFLNLPEFLFNLHMFTAKLLADVDILNGLAPTNQRLQMLVETLENPGNDRTG